MLHAYCKKKAGIAARLGWFDLFGANQLALPANRLRLTPSAFPTYAPGAAAFTASLTPSLYFLNASANIPDSFCAVAS